MTHPLQPQGNHLQLLETKTRCITHTFRTQRALTRSLVHSRPQQFLNPVRLNHPNQNSTRTMQMHLNLNQNATRTQNPTRTIYISEREHNATGTAQPTHDHMADGWQHPKPFLPEQLPKSGGGWTKCKRMRILRYTHHSETESPEMYYRCACCVPAHRVLVELVTIQCVCAGTC